MTRCRITAALAAVLASVGLAACGGDGSGGESDTSAVPSGEPTTGAGVTIAGFAIPSVVVTAGQEFAITNQDGATHTFTDKGGAFDVRIGGGSAEKLTVAEAGTYDVFCKIHTSMNATLTVE